MARPPSEEFRTTGYTPTEKSMMDILKDGQSHSVERLAGALVTNGYGVKLSVQQYIFRLRKKLNPGEVIVTEHLSGVLHYRLGRRSPLVDDE